MTTTSGCCSSTSLTACRPSSASPRPGTLHASPARCGDPDGTWCGRQPRERAPYPPISPNGRYCRSFSSVKSSECYIRRCAGGGRSIFVPQVAEHRVHTYSNLSPSGSTSRRRFPHRNGVAATRAAKQRRLQVAKLPTWIIAWGERVAHAAPLAHFRAANSRCRCTAPGYSPPVARAVYIETYGCQMNLADSELVLGKPGPARLGADRRSRPSGRHPPQHLRDPRACGGTGDRASHRPRARQSGSP